MKVVQATSDTEKMKHANQITSGSLASFGWLEVLIYFTYYLCYSESLYVNTYEYNVSLFVYYILKYI